MYIRVTVMRVTVPMKWGMYVLTKWYLSHLWNGVCTYSRNGTYRTFGMGLLLYCTRYVRTHEMVPIAPLEWDCYCTVPMKWSLLQMLGSQGSLKHFLEASKVLLSLRNGERSWIPLTLADIHPPCNGPPSPFHALRYGQVGDGVVHTTIPCGVVEPTCPLG